MRFSGGPGGSTRLYALAVRGGRCELAIDPPGGAEPGGGRTVTIRTDRVRLVRSVAAMNARAWEAVRDSA